MNGFATSIANFLGSIRKVAVLLLSIGAAASIGSIATYRVSTDFLVENAGVGWLTVVGVLVFATTLAWFVLSLVDILRWLRCPDVPIGTVGRGLSILLVLTALSAALSSTTARALSAYFNSGSQNTSALSVLLGQDVYYDTILFPAFEREGTIKASRIAGSREGATTSQSACTDDTPAFSSGLEISPWVKPTLDYLAKALVACGVSQPTVVRVRGFSSTSEFRSCENPNNSKRLNLLLANERSKAMSRALSASVARELASSRSPGKVVVSPQEWATYEEMAAERLFSDASQLTNASTNPIQIGAAVTDGTSAASSYSRAKGNLTRRAEVQFIDKGDCEARKTENARPPILPEGLSK